MFRLRFFAVGAVWFILTLVFRSATAYVIVVETVVGLFILVFLFKRSLKPLFYNYTEYWRKRQETKRKTELFEKYAVQVTRGWHTRLHLENTRINCFPDVSDDNMSNNDEVQRDIETVGNLYRK